MQTISKKQNRLILFLSVFIPVAVAALFGIKIPGYDLSFLPPIYATINGITAVLLLAALVAVKQKKIGLHRSIIFVCIACSVLFLVLYIAYHMTSDATPYGGEGAIRVVYYCLLISHIILSIVVIPLVLITFAKGFNGDVVAHKKWAKWSFPVWLYVAVTGVVVYYMISPYYS